VETHWKSGSRSVVPYLHTNVEAFGTSIGLKQHMPWRFGCVQMVLPLKNESVAQDVGRMVNTS
jgi:hypothetical protein